MSSPLLPWGVGLVLGIVLAGGAGVMLGTFGLLAGAVGGVLAGWAVRDMQRNG